jgi:formylglycine-generating enzyme required for sulfatase activity
MTRQDLVSAVSLILAFTPLLGGCTVGVLGGASGNDEKGQGGEVSGNDGAGGALPPGGGDEPTGAELHHSGTFDDPFAEDGYAFIPAGSFVMGSPPDDPDHIWWNGIDVEKQHEVTLTHSIWMSETEITQGQWLAVTGSNPSVFHACGLDCPVENVTWVQMVWFSNLLSQQAGREACYRDADDGTAYDAEDAGAHRLPSWPQGHACLGYRLPTEAEWEYAARAGTTTPHFLGANSHENIAQAAWYGPNSQCQYAGCDDDNCRSGAGLAAPSGPHPVGQRVPNAWGLYDTSGNVWELVWDFFGEYHDGPVVDPVGPMAHQAGYHVARGGSWLNQTAEARASTRDGDDCTCDPDNGPGSHTGFRVCRSLQ